MTEHLSHVFAILVCLVASASASGSETALTALGEARSRQLFEEQGKRSMKLWIEHPDRVLATILLVNTLVNTLSAAIMTDLMMKVLGSNAIAVATGAMTLLTLAFGEITPKALARRSAATVAPLAMPLISLCYVVTKPLIVTLSAAPRGIERLMRGPQEEKSTSITPEEIEYMIDLGVREGILDREKSELLTSVLDFGEIVAREMMVPRMKVVAIAADAPLDEVLKVIADSEHSRIPVFENSIDEVVGILHVKTFLAKLQAGKLSEPFHLRSHLSAPFFVPEFMKAERLLREFQRRRTHLAVVVDEFGGTAGVVALEDVVEEIVGDIQDELDMEEGRVKLLPEGRILADAAITLRELEDHLDVDFPDELDYDSLGGFVTHLAGKVPPPGSVVMWSGLRFTVKAGDERRVARVEIVKAPQLPAGSETAVDQNPVLAEEQTS